MSAATPRLAGLEAPARLFVAHSHVPRQLAAGTGTVGPRVEPHSSFAASSRTMVSICSSMAVVEGLGEIGPRAGLAIPARALQSSMCADRAGSFRAATRGMLCGTLLAADSLRVGPACVDRQCKLAGDQNRTLLGARHQPRLTRPGSKSSVSRLPSGLHSSCGNSRNGRSISEPFSSRSRT